MWRLVFPLLFLTGCAMLNPARGLSKLYNQQRAQVTTWHEQGKLTDEEYAKMQQELFLAERQERMNLVRSWAELQAASNARSQTVQVESLHCRPDLLGGMNCD